MVAEQLKPENKQILQHGEPASEKIETETETKIIYQIRIKYSGTVKIYNTICIA